MAEFDLAIIGWFPIAHHLPVDQLIAVLQRLKPGALLMQLYGSCLPEDAEQVGFRPVKTGFGHLTGYHFHERI